MTILKTFLVSAMALSASFVTSCSANSTEVEFHNAADKTRYQKPGAAVTYSHTLKSKLSAGETITFKLTLDESYDQGQLTVNLDAEGGITLLAPTQASFDMSTGTAHEMDISLTTNGNGHHYINVQAMATDAWGQTQPRIFSIPVQVGPKTAMKPNSNMKRLDNGQNVIEMEAQEEVIIK